MNDIERKALCFLFKDKLPDKIESPKVIQLNGEVYLSREYVLSILENYEENFIYQLAKEKFIDEKEDEELDQPIFT